MDDMMLVQVLHALNDLSRVALYFKFVQAFSSLNELTHGFVFAKVQQNVNVWVILEKMFELDDVVVVCWLVYLYLVEELLLLAGLGYRFLRDELGCIHQRSLIILQLVAFCKSALAQEAALGISSNDQIAIAVQNFFLQMLLVIVTSQRDNVLLQSCMRRHVSLHLLMASGLCHLKLGINA